MTLEELKQRTGKRVQALVVRDRKILMAKHREGDLSYWCLPGGALEVGETPEEGALRELQEEAQVTGTIIRPTSRALDALGEDDTYTFFVEIGDQEPTLGHDPEVDADQVILVDIQWLSLREVPERDRVFLWRSGLLNVPEFIEEIESWGDDVSYPGSST